MKIFQEPLMQLLNISQEQEEALQTVNLETQ